MRRRRPARSPWNGPTPRSPPPRGAQQPPGAVAPDAAAAQIRAHEEQLERLTRSGDFRVDDIEPASIREHVSVAAREVVDRIAAPVARVDEANVVNTVRELLSSDYYLRQWGRLVMRNRSEEVDDFG